MYNIAVYAYLMRALFLLSFMLLEIKFLAHYASNKGQKATYSIKTLKKFYLRNQSFQLPVTQSGRIFASQL